MTAPSEKTPDQSKKSVQIKFFSISLPKLYLLSVITFGFYDIYWFYKNWDAIKKAEEQKMSPFWRAVFRIFYAWSLFKKVDHATKEQGYKDLYPSGRLATIYVILLLIGSALARYPGYDLSIGVAAILVVLLGALPLLPIQKAMNYSNSRIEGNDGQQKLGVGEVIVIIIGVIICLLSLIGYFVPDPLNRTANSSTATSAVLSLEEFNESCISGATEGEGALTNEQATTYCTCMYNRGVQQYGLERWRTILEEAGMTNATSPEITELAKQCVATL
jgi:multisubunit Na+/H+ antiporter MnhG subunit